MFQIVIMITGLVAVVIRGSVVMDGGFPEIWRISGEGGRLAMNVSVFYQYKI